ncbi:Hypothetical predicted protein [Mytilus galloprovincialis]|uniref:Uncharacterized protein n=2 Tax=Mytilus galloprovincialis TaxID=29158 RepID=A0A8B6CB58_MYTGA|nr:Hypothetical predicted protein [Mytilus galloprovincialis]
MATLKMFEYACGCLLLLTVLTVTQGYTNSCRSGCYDNGRCHGYGETWESNCITKRCVGAGDVIQTQSVKCKDGYGKCVNHGDKMIVNMGGYGESCTCRVGQSSWDYVLCDGSNEPNKKRCDCEPDGVCRTFGERWEKNCFTYECQRDGNSWIANVVAAACKDAYGQCRHNGERMPYYHLDQLYKNCLCSVTGTTTRYQCTGNSNVVPVPIQCKGCKVNGVCHNQGSRWEENCNTYECQRIGNYWTMAKAVSRKCKDAYGNCRNHNEYMTASYNGLIFDNCLCQVNGLDASYHCNYSVGK